MPDEEGRAHWTDVANMGHIDGPPPGAGWSRGERWVCAECGADWDTSSPHNFCGVNGCRSVTMNVVHEEPNPLEVVGRIGRRVFGRPWQKPEAPGQRPAEPAQLEALRRFKDALLTARLELAEVNIDLSDARAVDPFHPQDHQLANIALRLQAEAQTAGDVSLTTVQDLDHRLRAVLAAVDAALQGVEAEEVPA